MPITCQQGSATLLQVDVWITITLEVVALPFRIRVWRSELRGKLTILEMSLCPDTVEEAI